MSGSKKELFDQLKKALDENVVVGGGKKRQKDKVIKRSDGESGMGKFPLSAHWRILDLDEQPTMEPRNDSFKNARAPTIEERDTKFVPVKFGFSKYKFSIPVFSVVANRVSRWFNERVKKEW